METTYTSARMGTHTAPEIIPVRYVLYARKSTEQDERQTLSIDSQIKEMLQLAERDSLEVVEIRREAHSAKDSGQRPVFKEILEDIRQENLMGYSRGMLREFQGMRVT